MVNLWKNEYVLELDVIDQQHRKFFSLCGEVVQLAEKTTCDKKSIKEIIRALGAMRSYAFLHFKTEEDLMLKHHYPGYLKHTDYHNSYLHRMMGFESAFKKMLVDVEKSTDCETLFRSFLKELGDFITDWWGAHIVSQDAKYADFIRSNGEGRGGTRSD